MINFAEEIKSRIKMPELLSYYGFEPQRNGRMPCPLHRGEDNNFSVREDFYKCFSCGRSGDIFSFVQEFFNLSFPEAMEKINKDFSLGLPIGEKISLRQKRDLEKKHNEVFEEIAKRKEEKQRLEAEYWAAFDEFNRLDKQKREFCPKPEDMALHPLYIEAIKDIETARFNLDKAQEALYKHEHR